MRWRTILALVMGSLLAALLLHWFLLAESGVRTALLRNAYVMDRQVEEAMSMRTYLLTGNPIALREYQSKEHQFQAALNALDEAVGSIALPSGKVQVARMRDAHVGWIRDLVQPLLKNGRLPHFFTVAAGPEIGSFYALKWELDERLKDWAVASERRSAALFVFLLLLLYGMTALVSRVLGEGSKLRQALSRERETVAILQKAFINHEETLPKSSVATAYLSAAAGATVGGDLFDVRRIDERRGYLLVADVSGKGVSASVDTMLVKYVVAALAQQERDPARILDGLKLLFEQDRSSENAFVDLFLGIFDWEELTLTYAGAGHAGSFLRSGNVVMDLEATGPLVGIPGELPFETRMLRLRGGDTLVLVTDGFTEARDRDRCLLGEELLGEWIAQAQMGKAREILATLLQRWRAWSGGEVRDDLAMVVLAVNPDAAPTIVRMPERSPGERSTPKAVKTGRAPR